MMEYAAYHIVYVDNRVSQDLDGKHIQKSASTRPGGEYDYNEGTWEEQHPECLKSILGEIEEVRSNLKSILSIFDGVHACRSGINCMAKVTKLESLSANNLPTLVILGTPAEGDVERRHEETPQGPVGPVESSGLYGLALLEHISAEISASSLSKLVVPVAMIHSTELKSSASFVSAHRRQSRPASGGITISASSKSASPERGSSRNFAADPHRTARCVDIGAIDVLTSPIQKDRLRSLTVHAYRAHKEALKERAELLARKRLRKLSWLGGKDNEPHPHLRETMVSDLMTGICNPNEVLHSIDHKKLPDIEYNREVQLMTAIGSWGFSGHEFSEDELVHAALLMLQHALSLSELKRWRISAVDLKTFLMASQAAYNEFVSYHNFRHVIDVMQAIFYFLIEVGILPSFPASLSTSHPEKKVSPIALLLKPFDALTLLITAIGHDVGHPGVNNAFLVALNAPLAQLYNDRSVLEAFHCAAYSQILRRYWRAAFEDIPMRGLMINSILATDMGVHMKYMRDLGNLQERLHHNEGTDGWSPQVLDEYRVLACALLVKCADISNVARPFDIAAKWANILQQEFANQGVMEKDVGIPTTLFGGPPELGNLIKLGNSQNSFMNIFARPLFEAVTDILPALGFAVEEIKRNQEIWTGRIVAEDKKHPQRTDSPEAQLSPRSGSPNCSADQPELSHPEGLPASDAALPPPSQSRRSMPLSESSDARRASATSIPPHLDSNLQSHEASRRSSAGLPLSNLVSTPDSAASFSRRSSGALSTANTPHTIIARRRSNNSSPSQLQLGPDPGQHAMPPVAGSENRQPLGRASEDTLSQTIFADGPLQVKDEPRGSGGSGDAGNTDRRGSKGSGPDYGHSTTESTHSGRPYAHSVHHRSSSGAHTNNTTMSQFTPYSPADTQATSVLTVDSDEQSSSGRGGGCTSPDRKGMPEIISLERLGSGYRFSDVTGLDGTKDDEIKTAVLSNGNIKDNCSVQRTVSRKSSRFNFNFWKKRAKGIEASP